MGTITVGRRESNLIGNDGGTIQHAIDQAHADGGGIVDVLPGEYFLKDAVRLRPNVHLRGTPGKTILKRAPLVMSKLVCDADRGQRVIYPEDVTRFRVGMGVGLFDRKAGWTKTSTPWTVVAIHEDHIEIDRILDEERYEENDGIVVNFFPMLQAVMADHSILEGVSADGSVSVEHPLTNAIEQEVADALRDPPPYFSDRIRGPRTALVFHQTSQSCQVRHVRAYNGTGDGFCFNMASEQMVMQHCEADHNGWYGIHPGSHSAFAEISHCHIHDNASDGLYVCWGVHHSKFTHNDIHDNGWEHWRSGISIGHKDTDNLIAHNRIAHNAKYGLCIRDKTPQNAPHRCTYQNNTFENNACLPDELREVKDKLPAREDVQAQVSIGKNVRDLTFRENRFSETRESMQEQNTIAFSIHPDTHNITIEDNQFEGIATEQADARSS